VLSLIEAVLYPVLAGHLDVGWGCVHQQKHDLSGTNTVLSRWLQTSAGCLSESFFGLIAGCLTSLPNFKWIRMLLCVPRAIHSLKSVHEQESMASEAFSHLKSF